MSFKAFLKKITRKEIENLLINKVKTDNPQQILELIQHDAQTNFRHYSFVKDQFSNALINLKYHGKNVNKTKSHDTFVILNQTLSAISKYPMFELNSQAIKSFHKIINDNIHQKNNDLLQKSLVFLVCSDSQVQNSPVYIQFVKFYLKDDLELIKSQISIDIYEENLLNTIKLFFLRIFQRGFLPRQPSYMRQLYIQNHTLLLDKMVSNKGLERSLMLKKVNFENLMKVKEFYEVEMMETLYHKKNTLLLEKMVDMVPYLCKSFELGIQLIERECKYLRELYVKLFLVIEKPQLKNCIAFYDMVAKDKQKLAQKGENQETQNKLLNQFCQKVQRNYQSIQSFKSEIQESESDQNGISFENQELFLILKHSVVLKLQQHAFNQLVEEFSLRISSAIVFKKYFQQILPLINQLPFQITDFTQVKKAFYQETTFELLDLNQTVQISSQKFVAQDQNIKFSLSKSIQKKNILHVGNEEILNFLQLYQNLSLENPLSNLEHHARQQTLIKFILRFLSDHHQNLPFDQNFQLILEIIFDLQQNQKNLVSIKNKDFNDQDGNYPNEIAQQLEEHLKKNHWKIKNANLKNLVRETLNL